MVQKSIRLPALPPPPLWIWSSEILFQNFQIFHNILLNFANFRGRPLSKSMQIPEKESKPSEIACKQSEPVRTVCKIEKRREFVRALCNEQCPKNSFKRLYTVKGLLVLVEKASIPTEFQLKFRSSNLCQVTHLKAPAQVVPRSTRLSGVVLGVGRSRYWSRPQ